MCAREHDAVLVQVILLSAQGQPSGMSLAFFDVIPFSADLLPAICDLSCGGQVILGAADCLESGNRETVLVKVVDLSAGLIPSGLSYSVALEEISLLIDRFPAFERISLAVEVVVVTAFLVPAAAHHDAVGLEIEDVVPDFEKTSLHDAVAVQVVPLVLILEPSGL